MSIVCSGVEYVAGLSDGVLGGVLGAVLGSGITLLGVWRQNVNSRAQVRMQLAHEAAQSDKERRMSIKREVYLAASVWTTESVQRIGALSEARFDADTISHAQEATEHIPAKVEVVGERRTVEMCIAFGLALRVAFAKLVPLRKKGDELTAQAAAVRRHQQTLKEGTPPWNAAAQEAGKLELDAGAAYRELGKEANAEMHNQILLQARLAVAMRLELGLPIDEDDYLKMVETANKEARKHYDAMFARLAEQAQ